MQPTTNIAMRFLLLLMCLHLLPTVQSASTFLPAPMDWKPPTEVVKPTPLILEEQYRSWLLINSGLTADVEFQNALSPSLTTVERSTHLLARHVLTKFPDIILSGEYVRDVVINNEQGFTGLDFYLRNDEKDGEPKTAITDIAASIQDFGTKNNLVWPQQFV